MNEIQIALVKELVKLREVGIVELDVLEASGDPKVGVPLLDSAAVNHRSGVTSLARSEAISKLLRNEIAKLSSPEYREWLPVSLGVKLGLATADPEELNKLASKLANHPSPNDFKRSNGRLQRAFHVLAAKIVADCFAEVGSSSVKLRPATADNANLALESRSQPYVHRPALEQQLRDLIDAGTPIIVVAGTPSVGKRTLVSQVIAEYEPVGVVTLDGSSDAAMQRSMFNALVRAGVHYSDIGDVPQYPLKELLNSNGGPDFLVIENATGSDLPRFFAQSCHAHIIVTTERRLPKVSRHHHIQVGMLEEPEAVELIQMLVLEASEEDATVLAQAVGYHVFAVVTACGLIGSGGGADIRAFCRGLQHNAVEIFDGERDAPLPALTQLYRQMLDDLGTANPQARTALELLAYLHNSAIPSALIVFALAHALGLDEADEVQQKAIALRALQALDDRYLISIDKDGHLWMPQLARTLVTHLVYDHGRTICEHLRAGILRFVALTRVKLPEMSLQGFVSGHGITLAHLTNTFIDPKKLKSATPVDYAYEYGHAVHAFLESIGEEPWRMLVLMFEQPGGHWNVMLQELPAELKDAEIPQIELSWNDPEPQGFTYTINHWETRKVLQLLVVDRSGSLVLRKYANDDA